MSTSVPIVAAKWTTWTNHRGNLSAYETRAPQGFHGKGGQGGQTQNLLVRAPGIGVDKRPHPYKGASCPPAPPFRPRAARDALAVKPPSLPAYGCRPRARTRDRSPRSRCVRRGQSVRGAAFSQPWPLDPSVKLSLDGPARPSTEHTSRCRGARAPLARFDRRASILPSLWVRQTARQMWHHGAPVPHKYLAFGKSWH